MSVQIACQDFRCHLASVMHPNTCVAFTLWIWILCQWQQRKLQGPHWRTHWVLQRLQHGQWGNTPLPLHDPFYRQHTELSCQDSCVLWGQRVVVPSCLQAQLLRELHEGILVLLKWKPWPEAITGDLDWINKLKLKQLIVMLVRAQQQCQLKHHATHGRVLMHPGIGFTWILVNTTISISL